MAEYNESQINSNETERISAEQQRINNEAKRQTKETEREARETIRQSNESARITEYNTFMAEAHNNYDTFIDNVENAEDERIANEEGRVQSEASRVTAEQTRISAEQNREQVEAGRVSAEQNRVTAEQDRVTRFNEMEAMLDKSTEYVQDMINTINNGDFATKDYVNTTISASNHVKTVNGVTPNEKGNVAISATLEAPPIVGSIEEMLDTNKQYVLSTNGFIYAYKKVEVPEKVVWVDVLADVGYQENMRLNSSGKIVAYSNVYMTNHISCKSGDTFKLEGFSIPSTYVSGAYYQDIGLTSDKVTHAKYGLYTNVPENLEGLSLVEENGYIVGFTLNESFVGSNFAYMVITSQSITSDSKVLKKTIVQGESGYQWVNTGISFTPTDYSGVITEIKNDIDYLEIVVDDLKNNNSSNNTDDISIPDYWVTELEAKTDTIQQAVENAGRNKSAFYWYTDAHWEYNAKKSPILLKYLTENTQINKINCGGDIICDPSPYNHVNTKYIHDWRQQVANLPNHHSVLGNHDVNHWTTDIHKMAYANVLAHEETPYMVVSDIDGCYYIDYPSEKTRYLYLSYLTSNQTNMLAQGQFIVDSIKDVKEGWHIVVIAHRWFQYTSSKQPTVGSVPAFEADILAIFDSYNARATRDGSNYFYAQDFTNCKGKVEFCIGGHIHADYDFTSNGGIPVIITTSDTNQERHEDDDDCGVSGTITEQAVYAIIADYESGIINVIGIGRGESRTISLN